VRKVFINAKKFSLGRAWIAKTMFYISIHLNITEIVQHIKRDRSSTKQVQIILIFFFSDQNNIVFLYHI